MDREVAPADHAHHAGHATRGIGVDAQDPRVRVRRQDEPRVQHAGPLHVARVARQARDLRTAVDGGMERPMTESAAAGTPGRDAALQRPYFARCAGSSALIDSAERLKMSGTGQPWSPAYASICDR
jgi:hypothetical protein